MKTIIEARKLRKTYGKTEAVKGISFVVKQGTCTGLLGPNGAGKTTTMRMLMGLTTISDGELNVLGAPAQKMPREIKAKIGLVSQEDNLDPDLTVRQNLEVYGRYYGLDKTTRKSRAQDLLEMMQITEKAEARTVQLSGGMKRRLTIARALIADPEIVMLDEPTTGLDPQARVMIWQRILALKKAGKTLVLTTHYMDEAQRLCDRIIVIDHGQILDEGTPQELIKRHVPEHVYEVVKPVPAKLLESDLKQEDIGDSVLFYTDKIDAVRKHLTAKNTYYHRPANLEDVFLNLTGRKLREGA